MIQFGDTSILNINLIENEDFIVDKENDNIIIKNTNGVYLDNTFLNTIELEQVIFKIYQNSLIVLEDDNIICQHFILHKYIKMIKSPDGAINFALHDLEKDQFPQSPEEEYPIFYTTINEYRGKILGKIECRLSKFDFDRRLIWTNMYNDMSKALLDIHDKYTIFSTSLKPLVEEDILSTNLIFFKGKLYEVLNSNISMHILCKTIGNNNSKTIALKLFDILNDPDIKYINNKYNINYYGKYLGTKFKTQDNYLDYENSTIQYIINTFEAIRFLIEDNDEKNMIDIINDLYKNYKDAVELLRDDSYLWDILKTGLVYIYQSDAILINEEIIEKSLIGIDQLIEEYKINQNLQ